MGQSGDLAGDPHLGLRPEDPRGAAGVLWCFSALAAAGLYCDVWRRRVAASPGLPGVLAPLMLLSLVLVNAQAVTSLTSERDARALDLLLVTDLTPKEIVYGKLGGVFYNTKEMVLLPMLLCVGSVAGGALGLENLLFLLGGLAVLYVFAATLGLHAGMTYANSGVAVATSLGTVFFLFVGVARVHEDHDGLQRLVQRPVSRRSSPSWCSAAWGCTRCWASAIRRRPSAWRRSSARSPRSTRSPAI